jgi:hypothetical protein
MSDLRTVDCNKIQPDILQVLAPLSHSATVIMIDKLSLRVLWGFARSPIR